jgi:hypothetical protein
MPSLPSERSQFREARASLHQRQLAGVERVDASRDYFSESRLEDLRAAVDARDELLAVFREQERG